MPIQSLNPANGKLLRSFDQLTPEALKAKLDLAASAAKTYPAESLDQRIFWMRRLALLLDADIEELAALITSEMGKTLSAARQEVRKKRRQKERRLAAEHSQRPAETPEEELAQTGTPRRRQTSSSPL